MFQLRFTGCVGALQATSGMGACSTCSMFLLLTADQSDGCVVANFKDKEKIRGKEQQVREGWDHCDVL